MLSPSGLKELAILAKKHGVTCRASGEQYRINYKGGRESTAWYANDVAEAVKAIVAMGKMKGRKL